MTPPTCLPQFIPSTQYISAFEETQRNRTVGNKLLRMSHNSQPVLEKYSSRSKMNALGGGIVKFIKKIRYLGHYGSKDFELSLTHTNDASRESLQNKKMIEDKQILLMILANHLRNNKSTLTIEGLFRTSSSSVDQNKFIKEMENKNKPCIPSQKVDVHIICNAIKSLIEQSLTKDELDEFSSFQNIFAKEGTLPKLTNLPTAFRIIQPLMEDVLANERDNLMTAKNLAIVIAPRFFSTENSVNTAENNSFLEALLLEYCKKRPTVATS